MTKIHDFTVKRTNGKETHLKDYAGKPLLIVNTASKCGLTPQFQGLQALYSTYQEKGFEILGFPCAQFMNQEFEDIEETMHFCQANYGVTFPMFAKVDVNGEHASPLFTYLKEQTKEDGETKDIEWNFAKFLIDADGRVVKRYAPQTEPSEIGRDIEELLA